MKIVKLTPFILLIVGTFGLLIMELFVTSKTGVSRSLVLIFAALNMLGLIILALASKRA